MLEGARNILSSDNPEKYRYYTGSMRILLKGVLKELAPDTYVNPWLKKYHQDFLKKRRLNKERGKIRYICRNIDQVNFCFFVEDIEESYINAIEIFNKENHKDNPIFETNQLNSIKTKAESSLYSLIVIAISNSINKSYKEIK